MQNINNERFKELAQQEDSVIIDCRTPGEWSEGVIADAILLDIFDTHNFVERMKEMDKDKPYLIYCRSGNRSGQACRVLESLGFTDTYNLESGMLGWKDEVVAPAQ